MGSRMFRLLLLGIFMRVFMDEETRVLSMKYIRICYNCNHFDGYKCHGGMKTCWKFNVLRTNRTCTTENYYYNDRITGVYLFRYAKLSCQPCEEGMFQVFHDLLRETFCCTDKDHCNDGLNNIDFSVVKKPDDYK